MSKLNLFANFSLDRTNYNGFIQIVFFKIVHGMS